MPKLTSDANIAVGTTLVGKYSVTREIGRGGMAAVYECVHLQLGKKVAVKVLSAELASSPVVTERFFREARAAASVRSPYIVDVYDSGRIEGGCPFIAMEYLEGESLYDRMARVRLIDPTTTVRVLSQCAKGLMKAHAAGIVHRDLKPENIHLTVSEEGEEVAKILDFGLAKFYAPVKPDQAAERLTREGAVFGTPAYMSPEQVRGQGTVDHRADLWALGCIAYECLTGRPVWNTEQGVAMTFAAIATGTLPVPSQVRRDLPLAFDEWFAKALERDPDRRFQTARDLAAALARALNAAPISLINVNQVGQMDLEAVANLAEELPSESVQLVESVIPPPILDAPLSNNSLAASFGRSQETIPGPPPPDSKGRLMQPSTVDPPPTTSPETVTVPPRRKTRASAYVLSAAALLASGAAAVFVYARILAPRISPVTIRGTAPSSSAQQLAPAPVIPPQEDPKWFGPLAEAEAALLRGDTDAALKKLKDAQDMGGGVVAKGLTDQLKATTVVSGVCKVVGLSHPRAATSIAAGRPSVAATAKGAIVTWTDDHEQAGHDHAYSVTIEPSGHVSSKLRDLTPEADNVMRPSLATFADRVALLYSDRSGREPGVRARWIDSEGRIDSPSVLVGAGHPGWFFPVMEAVADGFYVVWQDEHEKGHEDLFFRHLSPELTPDGIEGRATDYVPEKGHTVHVGPPALAVTGTNLFIAYPLERDRQHLIERMRIALSAPELKTGLEPRPPVAQPSLSDKHLPRELGDVALLNEDRVPGDFPSMACVKEACFVAWHEVGRGAHAAVIDPQKGLVVWQKRFAPNGSHPSLAVNADGQAELVYFEGGRVRAATVSREGIGPGTTIGRTGGDAPRPFIASGHSKGEWFVAWLDQEAGHAEPFAARIACRN